MSWDDQLQRVMFGDFAFSVQDVSDDWSRRVIDYDYPHKDGGELEDLGRSPRPTTFTAIFHGPDYLADLSAFLREIDKGKTQTLQHPLFGRWEAKCTRAQVEQTKDRRDFAMVSLEFLEDGVNTTLQEIESVGTARDEFNSDLESLTAANDALPVEVSKVDRLIADAQSFVDEIDDQITDLTARFQRIKKSAQEAVDELEEKVSDAINWETVKSARRLVNSAAKLKERTERLASQVTDIELSVHTPMVAIAGSVYRDPKRRDDFLRINKIRDPFLVPPGTKLRLYSE